MESAETPYLLAASEGWPRSTLGGDEFDPLGLGSLASWYSFTHSLTVHLLSIHFLQPNLGPWHDPISVDGSFFPPIVLSILKRNLYRTINPVYVTLSILGMDHRSSFQSTLNRFE